MVVRPSDIPPPNSHVIHRLANRRTGIGFDQLLWLETPRHENAHIFYRIYNRDGGEVEQCGNGARCIARLLSDGQPQELSLEHPGGIAAARVLDDGQVTLEMGIPEFQPTLIPFAADAQADIYPIDVAGETLEIGVVATGNPHAVLTVDSVDEAPVGRLGPLLESHVRFPNRANIGFMEVVSADRIRLRVFERGVGETQACGTGACAAMIIGVINGKLNENVTVELPGGEVQVSWAGPGHPVWQTGEALTVFEGSIEI